MFYKTTKQSVTASDISSCTIMGCNLIYCGKNISEESKLDLNSSVLTLCYNDSNLLISESHTHGYSSNLSKGLWLQLVE